MHIKFGYSFVAALNFLGEERKLFFPKSLQEVAFMCFSDMELFQLHEKETTGFVILC